METMRIKFFGLVMILSVFSLGAESFSKDGFRYDVVDSSYLRLVELSKSIAKGEVVIPDSVFVSDELGYLPVKTVKDNAFGTEEDDDITKIVYGENIDSIGVVGSKPFGLKEIDMSKCKVGIIPDEYVSASNLSKITFAKTTYSIDNNAIWAGKMTYVELPEACMYIADYAFGSCRKLKKVKLYDNVSFIGEGAFWYCTELSEIDWSKSLDMIGLWAFRETKIKEVIIPDAITYLGFDAFFEVNTIRNVICYKKNPSEIKGSSFFTNCDLSQCILWVPKGSLELYIANEEWGGEGFAEIREMDDEASISDVQCKEKLHKIYDLKGREVESTRSGNIYIIDGEKRYIE